MSTMKTFQELYENHPTIEAGAPFICVTEACYQTILTDALKHAADIAEQHAMDDKLAAEATASLDDGAMFMMQRERALAINKSILAEITTLNA